MVKVAVIGGTSLLNSTLFTDLRETTVTTDHGAAVIHVSDAAAQPLVFVQRHHADGHLGSGAYRLPHEINYRAIFAALRSLEVTHIVALCSVGSVDATLRPGTLVVLDDYFQLFGAPVFFHADARSHVVPGYDGALRRRILGALRGAGEPARESGTYIQTTGPRFETAAEVRFLSRLALGHVVGMTGASEATMARELAIPYACLCMVDNMANGMDPVALTFAQFEAGVRRHQPTVERALRVAVDAAARPDAPPPGPAL